MERSAIVGWNIPNFVSFVLMLGIIWCGVGVLSHLIVRKNGKNGGSSVFAANANVNAGPVGANVNIAA